MKTTSADRLTWRRPARRAVTVLVVASATALGLLWTMLGADQSLVVQAIGEAVSR